MIDQHCEDTVHKWIDKELDQQQQDHRGEIHATRTGQDVPDGREQRFDNAGQCVEQRIEKPVTDIQNAKAQKHGQDTVSQKGPDEGLNDHQDNGVQGKHAENLVGSRERPDSSRAEAGFVSVSPGEDNSLPECLTETLSVRTITNTMGL